MASISPHEITYETAHYGDDKGPALTAGSSILIIFATIAVVLRLASRRLKARDGKKASWAIDDYMIVVALVFAWGMFIAMLIMIKKGVGKHILRVGVKEALQSSKTLYVFEALYPFTTAFAKFSILLLYKRIFTTQNKGFTAAWYMISAVLGGWAISGFFTTVFQCVPVHSVWDQTPGTCIHLVPALVGLATINTLVNAAILILPIPMVAKLNMPLNRKIAVAGIFVIGSGDVVSSIVRAFLTSQVDLSNPDITWNEVNAAILAFIEPCLGIICACLPVIRPLFSRLRASAHSHSYRGKSSQASSNFNDKPLDPHSDSNPLSPNPLRVKPPRPEHSWLELESRGVVNSGIVGSRDHWNPAEQEVPQGRIHVQSDIESQAFQTE